MTALDGLAGLLLAVFVASAIASAFVGFFTPIGNVCNWVGWISLLILILLAVFGSLLQRREVLVALPGATAPPRTVATPSGGVALVGGAVD